MITRNFNLYLNAGMALPLIINVNQNDEEETWVFSLFDSKGIQYTPTSAVLIGLRTDGTRFSAEGIIDENGRVVISETAEITAVNGKAICEFRVDNDTHGTANFYLIIEKPPLK